ncbi:MAG: bacillithiol biosynthesis cysteine-adding enzyme BshC [Candidatus Acidiferrales bacterium]
MTGPMESQWIPFREIPQTTNFFTSYLENFDRVASYYEHPPTEAGIDAAARQFQFDPVVRQGVVEVLREQNRCFGTDSATDENLDRLSAGAVTIVTGQQVGLFSGPAYSLYKAISAIRCAEEATRRGIDAVPVFWLATEDHDLAEVNHSVWNTRNGLVRYTLPPQEGAAGRRVGEVTLGEEIEPLVTIASQNLEGSFVGEIDRALRESYTREETYGSAFGKLMARLLEGRGIIFIDPLDARLHRLTMPVYRRALEEAEPLRDALLERSSQLEQAGLHAQVKVTREATLLFYNMDGQRHPLRIRNGKLSAGKASFSREELLALVEKTPEDFTPNALLRPIVQDTLLPTAAYIGGPAEIAYMAQANVAYKRILGRMPAILPRASFTIVEPPVANLLNKYGLDVRDMLRGGQQFRGKMEQESLPRALARRFEKDEKALSRLLRGYDGPLERLDPTLLGVLQTVERKMQYQFGKLRGKAGRAENFRTGVLDRHERIMADSLYPHHGLQERSLCPLPLLASYGLNLLDDLARVSPAPGSLESSLCSRQHHIVIIG